MTVTTVATATFLTDTALMLRDDLIANITDPLSASRTGNEKFVMTSYPQRSVRYPIITLIGLNTTMGPALGSQSTLHYTTIPVEIRVWGRNVIERDNLSQQVMNRLRSVRLTTYVPGGLIDFEVRSAVNIDEPGDAGLHSKVITVLYNFILGS